jgi:hypothetical protein
MVHSSLIVVVGAQDALQAIAGAAAVFVLRVKIEGHHGHNRQQTSENQADKQTE